MTGKAFTGQQDALLRPMEEADLSAVMLIERQAYTHPWTLKIMRSCMSTGHYHAWVLELERHIQGYMLVSVAAEEAHILNLCVNPTLQGQGWGRRMLHQLYDLLQYQYKADVCFLEVRPSNESAVQLYQSEGFNEIGCRKNYYPSHQGREDAIVMAKTMN